MAWPANFCAQYFGPGVSNSICSPSETLCCVGVGFKYPSCQQLLGKGWCCVGGNLTDNCYVDQDSVCEESNAVPCTVLAKGTTQACCPYLTTCDTHFSSNLSDVRCIIKYGSLLQLASSAAPSSMQSTILRPSSTSFTTPSPTSSSTSSVVSSSPSSSTSSAIYTSITSLASLNSSPLSTSYSTLSTLSSPNAGSDAPALPFNTQGNPTLASNFLAGIIVGPVIAIVLVIILAWTLGRQWSRKRAGSRLGPSISQGHLTENKNRPHHYKLVSGNAYRHPNSPFSPSQELYTFVPTPELAAHSHPTIYNPSNELPST